MARPELAGAARRRGVFSRLLGSEPTGTLPRGLSSEGTRLRSLEPEDTMSLASTAPPIEREPGGGFRSRRKEHEARVRQDAPAPERVPRELVREIEAGNCVAFVGAGFSGASQLPDWRSLLREIAQRGSLAPPVLSHIDARIDAGSAHALEEAAQMLEDYVGRERFVEIAQRLLCLPGTTPAMEQRLAWLHGIPFRAILTTNFDGLLHGETPGAETYRQALRPEEYRWWSTRYWSGDGAYTVKLHGDLARRVEPEIVLTRRDYRERLYRDPAYETFLRAILSTTTVLYLGFSFEDAYLNELRSEVLALLGHERESGPVAYALANDVPEETRRHFRQHEGIELLSFDSRGGSDFSGFDEILEEIHSATNPLLRFARYLEAKRILWVDPHPQNNAEAFAHLEHAAAVAGRTGTALVTVDSADEAIQALRGRRGFDLVITHWGRDVAISSLGETTSTAERLLTAMRQEDVRCPVVVFAAAEDADERKRNAQGLGAQDYCFTFAGLYRTLERVLGPANATGAGPE